MKEPSVVELIESVPLAKLAAMQNLPAELAQQIALMVEMGATVANVMSVLADDGYQIVISPVEEEPEEEEDDESEMESEDESEMESEDESEMEPEMDSEDEYEEEDEYEDYDEESAMGYFTSLIDRLRTIFGKAISFEQENQIIARNRKRASAKQPHEFQRAIWTTRKGVLRCRICGSTPPVEGNLCAGVMVKDSDEVHKHDHSYEYGNMTLRAAAEAQAYDLISESLGAWDYDSAHYIPESPFQDEGLVCANCVAYCPELNGCYWVEGSIAPEGICKLWVIPERMPYQASSYEEMAMPKVALAKVIVEREGAYCVLSEDGQREFGCYPTIEEAQRRLDQVEYFSKQSYTPNEGMKEEAEKGLAWREEYGRGGTMVGVARARDISNGRNLSLDTVMRMRSYFARHAVDKEAEGFSPGEDGFPSNGRIAWALWGGDAGERWANAIVDSLEKENPTVSDVHVDGPMGSGRRRRLPAMYKALKDGSFVRWNSSGGPAYGKIIRIETEGTINIPDSSFSINATEDDPAALIELWRRTAEGWSATEQQVGHKLSTLTEIAPLSKEAQTAGILRKADERRYTLGPWYVPDSYDAHGEWTDPVELQESLWGYMKNADRMIRLQHNVDVVAGECVEAMAWPYPCEVPMWNVELNRMVTHEFPAGTVFMGVVWEDWAWQLVKEGKIRGYSIGGSGERLMVDLPEEKTS